MNDILDLPGWTVLAKRLHGAEYELEAEYAARLELMRVMAIQVGTVVSGMGKKKTCARHDQPQPSS